MGLKYKKVGFQKPPPRIKKYELFEFFIPGGGQGLFPNSVSLEGSNSGKKESLESHRGVRRVPSRVLSRVLARVLSRVPSRVLSRCRPIACAAKRLLTHLESHFE